MFKSPSESRKWTVLAVLCVSLLIVSLDNTILNVALPTLVRDLHASSSQLQWIVDAYTVVFAGLELTAGSLGDRRGRRGALLVGLAIFGLGSGLSAFSGSPDRLIAFRALMGVGGALVMPSTLSILTNVFTRPTERARAIGIWSGTSGLGIAIGPILGGWLLSHFWWGSVFLVNVPVVGLGILAAIFVVPTSKDPSVKRADPVGTGLSVVGLGALLWGIIEAPVKGWGDPTVVLPLAAGLGVLAVFVRWEQRSSHPMFRMDLFKRRRFSAASVSVALVFFALFGAMFMLTQYLQSVMAFSPIEAGVRIAPVALMLMAGAPISSLLAERLGSKVVVGAGLGIVAIGMGLLSSLQVSTGYLLVLIALLVLGLGMGLTMASATESIMGSLPKEEAGVGSAMNGTTIQVGGALGVAIMGSLLNQRYRDQLAAHGSVLHILGPSLYAVARSSLGAALSVAQHLPPAAASFVVHTARAAFVSGVNLADLVGMGVAIVGVVVAVAFLPSRAPQLPASERTEPQGGPGADGGPSDREAHGVRQGAHRANGVPAQGAASSGQLGNGVRSAPRVPPGGAG